MGLDGSRYGNINRDVIALDNIKWDVISLGMVILNGTLGHDASRWDNIKWDMMALGMVILNLT